MAERYELLDLWMALRCDPREFDAWLDQSKMTRADAWAQLLAAVGGNVNSLCRDTNPPAHPLLVDAARLRVREGAV